MPSIISQNSDMNSRPGLSAEKMKLIREQVNNAGKNLPQNMVINFKTKDKKDASIYIINGKIDEYQELNVIEKKGGPAVNYSYKDNNHNGSFETLSVFTWDFGVKKVTSFFKKFKDDNASPYYKIK